jgi:hypothetical protein
LPLAASAAIVGCHPKSWHISCFKLGWEMRAEAPGPPAEAGDPAMPGKRRERPGRPMSDCGLDNLDPEELAKRALAGEHARRWVLVNLGYVIRHHRERADLIDRVGALICVLAGPKALRRVAESAEIAAGDGIGEIIRLRLLSGYWRTDEVQRQLAGV